MRRLRFSIALGVIGALAALVTGCGGSDPNEAKTPANAETITNGHEPVETTFSATCQGCHAKGGTQAAIGPVLANRGLTPDAIRTQIVNGHSSMPPGLVRGASLENVIAYVMGLQGGSTATTSTATATTSTPTTTPPTPTATTPTATSGGGGGDATAIAAGKTYFEGTCQACHTAGGTVAGVGPVLAGRGLTADRITHQVVNGGAAMPPGLASGVDLENVTKFVLSLQ
jgi:mono/diheme cytochrome c family protein